MEIKDNFEATLNQISYLKDLLQILDQEDIRYGLYAGAYISFITSSRTPTDVDLLVADEDWEKLKQLFPSGFTKEHGGSFLYPNEDHKVEFMSHADIDCDDSHYQFRLTDKAWERVTWLNGSSVRIRLCDPIETILLKAMLQRGIEKGKHDLEDIEALLKTLTVSTGYLKERLLETGTDDRLNSVLQKYQLI